MYKILINLYNLLVDTYYGTIIHNILSSLIFIFKNVYTINALFL